MKRLLLALLSLAASSPAFSALSTNNLGYYFDFNSQSAPGKCIYGSGNTPITSPSPISYNAGALTWHSSGGVDDSGYIQTRQGSSAADESLKISSSAGIPPIDCTNFAVSFNMRNYKRGAALFIINGSTVNNSWGIWGVGGGTPSWKEADGSPAATAPPLNTTNEWQSVIYSFKGKTATLFIDGKNRGSYTFIAPFAGSPRLTLFGLGMSGTTGAGNASVAADFDNIALWSQAIESEADARSLLTARPDEVVSESPIIPAEGFFHRIWNFNNQEEWTHEHQNSDRDPNKNPDPKSVFENGMLKISVRPDVYDRRKAAVPKIIANATTGRYKWRLYLPKPGPGDICSQASFAGFIYNSDTCELDFEIAQGKQADRNKYGAQDDEMLAMMTNQAYPFSSVATRIKHGWHTIEIDLTNRGGNYYAQWLIDGKVVHSLQTTLAANQPFGIYCSLESLRFTGDYYPKNTTTALFDQVEYYYHP